MKSDISIPYHKLFSFTFNVLCKINWFKKIRFLRKIWWTLFAYQKKIYQGNVKTKLHGYDVVLNNGHTYPFILRDYPFFNNPLVELVAHCYQQLNRKLSIIDVGAAVGDTILLIEAHCSELTEQYYAVDADEEFFLFQKHNLKSLRHKVTHLFALLSDTSDPVPNVQRTLSSTGSATGTLKPATTLDDLILPLNPLNIDIIKVDVDGYDGKVLKGSSRLLSNFKPAIIIEWNTPYYALTQNNPLEIFPFLQAHEYERLIWFKNDGSFSHFSTPIDLDSISLLEQYVRQRNKKDGFHFDIIALHKSSKISNLSLAELRYFENKTKII